jgi:hypothetical protein
VSALDAPRLLVPVLLALAMVGVIVWSADYAAEARALPVLVAWTTIVLLALEALVQTGTRAGRFIERMFSGEAKAETGGGAARRVTSPGALRELRGIAWPAALVAAIVIFGILPAVPAYVFLSLKIAGGKSGARAALTAIGVTVFVWTLFEWGMSYQLFRGALFGDFQGF